MLRQANVALSEKVLRTRKTARFSEGRRWLTGDDDEILSEDRHDCGKGRATLLSHGKNFADLLTPTGVCFEVQTATVPDNSN